MFVNLKPASERTDTGQQVIARLRPQLQRVTGVSLFLNPVQDLRMGGRQSNSTYQYTLKSDNRADLKDWASRLADAMKAQKALIDVDTDQADNGVETFVSIDKDTTSRLGMTVKDVDNALYNAFGQRQVATIYDELNQYKVVMEVAPEFAQSPEALRDVYVPRRAGSATAGASGTAASAAGAAGATAGAPVGPASGVGGSASGSAAGTGSLAAGGSAASTQSGVAGVSASASTSNNNVQAARDASSGSALSTTASTMVPLSAISTFAESSTATSVNHQDGELATTVSFNLAQGYSLSQAQDAVKQAEADIGMPNNVRGSFQGTARSAQESNQQQPLLILAALVVIYIVLGILYESLVHPVTVLSTLPSAGVGAVLALLMFKMEFSIIALIGVFLLIGIVKKNAILIIDFALEAERARGLSSVEAVREACLLRFRPILMTTLAAALGALPLAIGFGEGSELRQPLGIAIIGGLIASQLLTLLTTPVVYVLMDKLRRRSPEEHLLSRTGGAQPTPTTP
jgi:multidrug efflux pump